MVKRQQRASRTDDDDDDIHNDTNPQHIRRFFLVRSFFLSLFICFVYTISVQGAM